MIRSTAFARDPAAFSLAEALAAYAGDLLHDLVLPKPDRRLLLAAVLFRRIVAGFEAIIALAESEAIRSFINRVVGDELPIIMSVNGGNTIQPRVTDDLIADLDFFGRANCIVRYWSGKLYPR